MSRSLTQLPPKQVYVVRNLTTAGLGSQNSRASAHQGLGALRKGAGCGGAAARVRPGRRDLLRSDLGLAVTGVGSIDADASAALSGVLNPARSRCCCNGWRAGGRTMSYGLHESEPLSSKTAGHSR